MLHIARLLHCMASEVVWYTLHGIRGCVVHIVWHQRLCGTRRISARYVTVTARRTASQCRNPPPCFLPGCFYFYGIYSIQILPHYTQKKYWYEIIGQYRVSLCRHPTFFQISHLHPILITVFPYWWLLCFLLYLNMVRFIFFASETRISTNHISDL